MKQFSILLIFTFLSGLVFGQNTWHFQLPFVPFTTANTSLSKQAGKYYLSTHDRILKLDEAGAAEGLLENLPPHIVWGSERKFTQSGRPYFLLVQRYPIGTQYQFLRFEPEIGITSAKIFEDSLLNVYQNKTPVVLEANDSTFFVFGSRYARKIVYQKATGNFSESWIKNLNFNPKSAVLGEDKIIACGFPGTVKAFDLSGNVLWEQFFSIKAQMLQLLNDGYIVLGSNNLVEPVLLKLDLVGNLLWSKTLPGLSFSEVKPTPDGGFVITGRSFDSKALLLKTNSEGEILWERFFIEGKGLALLCNSDGTIVVLYSKAPNLIYLAKTNEFGETTPVKPLFIKERDIKTTALSATQWPSATLFFQDFSSSLKYPADSSTSTLYVHSPWIGGLDSAQNLFVSANNFSDFHHYDFRSGIAASPVNDFNRVWSVTRDEINRLRRDFQVDQNLDQAPSFDLLTWPAKRNPHLTQNLDFTPLQTDPDSLPAPFVDFNGDGTYNIFDGDYPLIKGDRMLWWPVTDQVEHTESHSPFVFSLDLFNTLYTYDCAPNSSITHSLFYECQVVNRNTASFHDMYFGYFTDFDLGCSNDDYLGTLVDANSVYAYNIGDFDGETLQNCLGPSTSFQEKIPVQSISFLNHELNHTICPRENPTAQNYPTSIPTYYTDFYKSLNALWLDNTPLTYGGSGYDLNSPATIRTDFIYTGNPHNPSDWAMSPENTPFGRQFMVSSHGPFAFASGDTFTMRLALTIHPDIPHPRPDIFGLVKPTLLEIQQWHDDGTLDANLDLGSVLSLQAGQFLPLDATVPNATGYLWSTGATTANISVTQTGEYTVTVTRASGCDIVESVLVKSPTTTSSPTLPSWQIQPNPTSEVVQIRIDQAGTKLHVLLRNAQGQVVSSIKSSSAPVEISVAQLPSGLYWAELWQDGLFLGSRKVVVAK